MKKILALMLCIIMSVLAMVSCEEKIGEQLQDYIDAGFNKQSEREEVELDFYIIMESGTAQSATKTVNQAINKYLEDNYKTKLSIHYLTESEYASTVLNDVKSVDGKVKADIVLINSKDLYTTLMNGGYLAPLDDFLDSTKIDKYLAARKEAADNDPTKSPSFISKDIPKIKADIPECLFNAAAESNANGNTCFVIPNNRPIGQYKYLVIDKDRFFAAGYSENVFSASDFDAETLKAELDLKSIGCEIVLGSYSDRDTYKAGNKLCHILEKPTIGDDVFDSAFAVVNGTGLEDRAMEIIYALNTEVQFRNLLQYGEEFLHYKYETDGNGDPIVDADGNKNIVRYTDGATYNMNIYYTGNIFTAYFSEELDWTPAICKDAIEHNKEATVKQ